MKKPITKLLLVAILLLAFGMQAYAQSDFAESTANVSKIKARQDFNGEGRTSKKGTGWSTNVQLLDELPKKVALVTFYLEDPGTTKQKKSSTQIVAKLWSTDAATAQAHVNGFYNESIDDLKAGFEKMGMTLLTPDEFLTSDDKKTFYNSFMAEHGPLKKNKLSVKSMTAAGTLNIQRTRVAADGYKVIWVNNENLYSTPATIFLNTGNNDAKFFESMGYKLAEGLGVDAVAAVTIVTRKPKENYYHYGVNAASLYVFTKNPIQLAEEEDTGLKGMFYIRGQFLAGSRVTYSKPELFQYQHKKKGYGPVYDGMGNVMTAMTNKIDEYFQKRISKK